MDDKFKKIDVCRHLLPPPGAEAVGECIDKIREMGATKQELAEMLLKALIALGKRHLKEANENNEKYGTPDNWPAGMDWKQMVSTSHSIFLMKARDEAGIDTQKYLDIIRNDKEIDMEKVWNELC